jgi:hypothetical protein
MVAFHRFAEISIGIVVGLVIVLFWQERAAAPPTVSTQR